MRRLKPFQHSIWIIFSICKDHEGFFLKYDLNSNFICLLSFKTIVLVNVKEILYDISENV